MIGYLKMIKKMLNGYFCSIDNKKLLDMLNVILKFRKFHFGVNVELKKFMKGKYDRKTFIWCCH